MARCAATTARAFSARLLSSAASAAEGPVGPAAALGSSADGADGAPPPALAALPIPRPIGADWSSAAALVTMLGWPRSLLDAAAAAAALAASESRYLQSTGGLLA